MNITTAVMPSLGTPFTMSGGAATATPEARISPTSVNGDPGPGALGGGAAGGLFKNLEAFAGQVQYTPPKLSARQEGKMARRDATRLARHAERTSEHIRGGLDRKADMVVGPALRVHAQPDWHLLGLIKDGVDDDEGWKTKKPFAKACERVFRDWADDDRLLQDAEGHYNFGGMMWMAFRNLVGPDGECAGIIHYDEARKAKYGARYATYVTILDPDRIETPPDQVGKTYATDGYDVFEGKKLDRDGRMIGFWVANKHPSEGLLTVDDAQYTFVPRETRWGRAIGFHFFQKTRGGQMRGITKLVTVLRKTGMIDTFDDANVGAAIVNQVLANYIETSNSADTVAENIAPAGAVTDDFLKRKVPYYEKAKIRIGGARIPVMPPGDKIVMSAVNRATGDPTAFRNNFLREFASALGISFEQLSMNFSDANYSAARAALLEVWRSVLTLRKFFTAHVAKLIYSAVVEEGIATGKIPLPPGAPPFQENRGAYTACMWTGPGMGWIDPQKEANALKTMLEIKMKSRTESRGEMDGGDIEETFDDIEEERAMAEDRGFTLDPLAPGTAVADDPQGQTDDGGGTSADKKKPIDATQKDGDGDGVTDEGDD
jgi:lambda family phage portal protein